MLMMLCGCALPLGKRLTLAASSIRRCSGHGDFKRAATASLALLELAAARIDSTTLPSPIRAVEPYNLLRKAYKVLARMLQYYKYITKHSAVDEGEVASRIASMPPVFLGAALDACVRLVSLAEDEISPRFQELYTTLLIRACGEYAHPQERHVAGLVRLFAATPSNAEAMLPQMQAVSAAVGQDGRGMLLQLLAWLPSGLPAPCANVFLQVADACALAAVGCGASGLPVGVEARVIQCAMDLMLDAPAAAAAATTATTLLHLAAAEPTYARALVAALEPHMALAPARELARNLLLTRCSTHVPAAALQRLVAQQPLPDKLRIVCGLVAADVPIAAVLPLTQSVPLPANNNELERAPTSRVFDELCDADKAAMQEATDALCRLVSQHGSRHPAAQLLVWLCTVAVKFKPSLTHLSTAMGVHILLSSVSAAITMSDIGCLAFVYPQHCWVNADMHCWMLFSS